MSALGKAFGAILVFIAYELAFSFVFGREPDIDTVWNWVAIYALIRSFEKSEGSKP